MKPIVVIISVIMLASLAAGATLSLSGQDLYCERYGISFFCSEEGVQFLEALPPDVVADFGYINDYAFSDAVRYTGKLKITDISVSADLTTSAGVEAVYTISNPSDGNIAVEIAALETPENTRTYVVGQEVLADPLLDGIWLNFGPREAKEIKFVFSEPLYGEIFGYNINLLFDNKTVDNHIAPSGSFVFTLPRGATSVRCVPSSNPGYTMAEENGRTTVTWSYKDFIPWTNPFNDLICAWDFDGDVEIEEESPEGDSSMLIILVLILILALVAVTYKKGMLDGVLRK
jgi:hypothetical protein